MKPTLREFLARIQRAWPTPKTWAAGFLAAGALLWLNDRFCFESIQIPASRQTTSSSMQPTLQPNERAWLQRVAVGRLQRGDVVVLASPSLGQRLVKRIVGLPGERVRLEDSWRVFINGQPLPCSPVAGSTNRWVEVCGERQHELQLRREPQFSFATKFGREDLQLGPDEYFVLGDNRLASADSRVFGPVKRQQIQGKLRCVWYSYDLRAGRVRWERIGACP